MTDTLGDAINSSAPQRDGSPFRAFSETYFVESDTWVRLKNILGTNGGAYALAGPRGAGKSWLMQRALSHAHQECGLSLWYPSPSHYSAFEFLSTLSDNFANQVERRYRPDRSYPTLASSPWRVAAGAVLVTLGVVVAFQTPAYYELPRTAGLLGVAGTGAFILWSLWRRSFTTPEASDSPAPSSAPRPPPRWIVRDEDRPSLISRVLDAIGRPGGEPLTPRARVRRRIIRAYAVLVPTAVSVQLAVTGFQGATGDEIRQLVLAAVALVTGFVILVATLRSVAAEREPEQLLTREAALLRERIRFSSKTKEATEVSAKAGWSALVGGLKAAREKELVERPTTVASLIHDFRALAASAAAVSGKVVIAIDELDKIADANEVRALLRDIKGIFEIPGVFFLVSVSDEVTRSLNLGGVAGRDEFNSSFYTVIDVPPMDDRFLLRFFTKRELWLDPQVASALSLLAGNNPRETLRLVDAILRAGAGDSVHRAVSVAMITEVRAFRAQAMTSAAPGSRDGLSDDEKTRLAAMLDDVRFAPDVFGGTAQALMDEWAPEWAGPYWARHLQDPWGRLLIRLRVAAEVVDDRADVAMLAEILRALEESPAVARQALTQRARMAR